MLLLLATCLIMMAFVLHEAQWESKLINVQHLVNECVFYLLCISLIIFNGVIFEADQVQKLSWLMILCISSLIVFNVIVIVFDTVLYIRLIYRRNGLGIMRIIAKLKAKMPSKSSKKLHRE